MARFEVSIQTGVTFHSRRGFGLDDLPRPETVPIDFEDRRFVWHAIDADEDGREYWPTVTTMLAEGEEHSELAQAMQRFFSALAFMTKSSIEPVVFGVVSYQAEMAPPFLRQPRRGFADYIRSAPAEVIVHGDERLRICLGHFRDGLNTSSPFFRFLAFWNALDVACDDYHGGLPAWVRVHAAEEWGADPPPEDAWEYLRESSRNAVAHAVREPGRPEVDPDDPEDRGRLEGDAGRTQRLAQLRIAQRWGDDAVSHRPRV